MSDICPHCGKQGQVASIRKQTSEAWRCCGACGQTWVTAPELDAFSAIVASPAVFVRAQPDACPTDGQLRALRFAVRLPVRYRVGGSRQWREGLTENISRSGVFLRIEMEAESAEAAGLSRSAMVEVVLDVPGGATQASDLEIRCEGRVVRTTTPEMPGLLPGVGIAVRSYRLQSAAAA